MKTLITAVDIANMAKGAEKILYVSPNSLITPAARDAAKDWGIEIIIRQAVVQGGAETAGSVNTAMISQIVGEVLASLNITGAPRQLMKEADPCGLRLVRGDSIVLENFPTGNAGDKLKLKELFSTKDSPFMSAGVAALEEASCTCDIRQDEANYILNGAVTVTVQGREYVASSGDVLFIPAGTQVTYATREKVKWFFVTHPRKNRAQAGGLL
jgi:ethanolamine utilization protein EutQ